MSVTHEGTTLPLSQVPNLTAGDRLRVAAALPKQQGARYRLVLAFLRGATNPPPKEWLVDAETWKLKKAAIEAVVPPGAEQAVVLLVPDTGGAVDAVTSAIRGRPGAFVRASQELNQAMLDRTRLATYVDQIRGHDPAELSAISPQLAQSLAVKLDTDCLLRQPDARAACLTQGSNAAVLADGQTSSIAQTLAGTPADIALQLSSTPQAGFGYYSPYIGVVRDVARLLGAFQSAQLQFIPALGVPQGELTGLLLNTVPSFRKPQSVLVAALPSVAATTLPPLAATTHAAQCASQPRLVLPVTGAPLVFSTGYARQMMLRVRGRGDEVQEIAATADPAVGGFNVDGATITGDALPGTPFSATLHGYWGFQPFDGPRFRLVVPAQRPWQPASDTSLVVGRDTPLMLQGGAAACIASVWMERDTTKLPVSWTAEASDRLSLKVPLAGMEPGKVVLLVQSHGVDQPQRLELRAYAEAGRITGFTLHAGDQEGVLTGTRLDQVTDLALGGVTFRPAALGRAGASDRLSMTADSVVTDLSAGQSRTARVTLADGRSVALPVTIAASRPAVELVNRSVQPSGPPPKLAMQLQGTDLLPQDAQLVFSLKAEKSTLFDAGDKVEVKATETGQSASLSLTLQDRKVALARLDPKTAFGSSAYGPLRFRVVHDGAAGDWQPLVTLVRLPTLDSITCPTPGNICVLSGTDLFLIRSVAAGTDPQSVATVPDGFTGTMLGVPRSPAGSLTLTLRDAPEIRVMMTTSDLYKPK